MSKISENERATLHHKIYGLICENPRIPLFRIAKKLGISRNTAGRHLQYMYDKGILFGPEMRLKSFPSMEEHCYFLKCEDPLSLYEKLKSHPDLIYECMSIGDWDLLAMTKKAVDFSDEDGVKILIGGKRGDFFYPKPKLQSWEKAYESIHKMIEDFSIEEKSSLDEDHENPLWEEEEWRLFHEFKYDLRKKTLPILKKHDISWETYENWYKSLPQYAMIFSNFYPEGYENYTDFTILVESDYEKDVMKIFRLLPTSTVFLKINKMIRCPLILRKDNPHIKKIIQFMKSMEEKKIINRHMKVIDIIYFTRT